MGNARKGGLTHPHPRRLTTAFAPAAYSAGTAVLVAILFPAPIVMSQTIEEISQRVYLMHPTA
jgi:hypothetical protein